jgi:hypothetical protein
VILKGLHGKVPLRLQRLIDKATGAGTDYLALTGQFEDNCLSPHLQEVAAYYSNRLSYEEVAGLVQRMTGERLLSDQRIEQLVIEKAVAVSEGWATERRREEESVSSQLPVVNPTVNLYESSESEILLLDDGIGVKAQKSTRARRAESMISSESSLASRQPRIITDVMMLQRPAGEYQYFCAGMDRQGEPLIDLESGVRRALLDHYGQPHEPLNVVVISDGAQTIRQRMQRLFGTRPVMILDWYHLEKKTREFMSMIASTKTDKERPLEKLLGWLWQGDTTAAIDYLRHDVAVRNTAKHSELIGYFEKHAPEIIDYGRRQAAGKPIGSGRMEKGVDQVIGQRQKKKAMSWSPKGSKALAILKVVELNGQWQSLWFPDEQDYQAAA